MKQQEFIELEQRLGAHNYKPLDVVLSKGQGVWVWDVDGRRYMDWSPLLAAKRCAASGSR